MKVLENEVRGIPMKFVGYTRSLELCSQMNYETENLDFIDQIKEDEILYDLGACEGRFSIYASLKGILCYSFEPEKNNFDAFLSNIELNNASKRIRPFKMAIGDVNKKGKLKIGQPWAGGHQKVIEQSEIREDLSFDFKEEELVDVVSLDEFIDQYDIEFPNYIKIDIDGSELAFIKGAQKTLGDMRLRKIIFELEINDKNFNSIMSNLSGNGFEEENRIQVPNEKFLYNIIFRRSSQKVE
ncbi:MAG TPA: FkbM family methyltransferase [Puia sp.]|nr:FkbM family methyltransferase [Puia sp.]